ncbi:hypothetical protein AM587_10000170 [Phytophthora nicotianae]|uniref:Uncharacterized protein n=1 Tax=Phytophthora nicotianae TaxID=4792 RepID=A0A0W8CCX6_PHYNI|nr:hypothetical protein AM587_10000170 [Phytophthora nicotianae]
MVVLSDTEKYARAVAVFEPLIEKLCTLSTIDYYQQMSKWKAVIENNIAESGAETTSATTVAQGDSDSDSFLDQLDYADAMAIIEAEQGLAMEVGSLGGRASAQKLLVASGSTVSQANWSEVSPRQSSFALSSLPQKLMWNCLGVDVKKRKPQ